MRKTGLLFIIMIITLVSCPTENETSEQKINDFTFTKEYWGEWIRLDTGQTWYINDKDIIYNNVSYPNKISLRKENKDAIEITEGNRKYYIYASRTKGASFSGRVVSGSDNVIGGSNQGVGSISVVISNLHNASDYTIVVTDDDGNYLVEDIIPWDTYDVTIDGKTWTVTPGDGDDVGIMALRDGVNLKAYLTCNDADRIFADKNDSVSPGNVFSVNIENVGNKAAAATSFAYYTLESPNMRPNPSEETTVGNVTYSTIYDQPGQYISLEGLKPGARRRITFSLSFDPITEEYEIKKIGFTLIDPAEGVTFKDYAIIKVKTPVRLNIEAQSLIHGVVVAPYKKAYNVRTGNGITLPWGTADYILILTSHGQSTPYSLGIDSLPSTQWGLLTDNNIFKPQNTVETAAPIGMYEQKMAFLFENGIDYWRINMADVQP